MPQDSTFSDIENHWARDCIVQLQKRKLAFGYPDGRFRPDATITRAEFALLMLNAFPDAKTLRPAISFEDVPTSHWAFNAIKTASEKIFFSGYPDGTFKPDKPIPRVQAIISLAAWLKYSIPPSPTELLQQCFDDDNEIPNYAKDMLAAATLAAIVVNYPNVRQLKPNQSATRGEVAALLCRALNIYAVPPQYIAGVEVQLGEVRALPGGLDTIPTFNSNSPELVLTEGILLSTFPPEGKRVPSAHLNFAFEGRFDLFSHHITRAETPSQMRTLYQGVILHNPSSKPVTVEILQAATYLGTPDAPFSEVPDMVNNPDGTVYSGPGSRTMNDVLRGLRHAYFPAQLKIEPGQSHLLVNLPIPIWRTPSSNGRSLMMRLSSNGPVYVANLAMKAPLNYNGKERVPTLVEWQTLLKTGKLAEPRDPSPTPLDPIAEPITFSRVAGVSCGTQWKALIADNSRSESLSIPQPGKAFSYPLATLHKITLGTGQIQSAKMLVRYPDTAYFAHSNYGIEYNLKFRLYNWTNRTQTVTITMSSPLKDSEPSDRLLFLKLRDRAYFRGTVRASYDDERGKSQTVMVHLVQRRGQQGKPLITLKIPVGDRRLVQVDFLYPPDSTPPQILTIATLDKS